MSEVTWPAEWEDHTETVVLWPGSTEVWGTHLTAARHEYGALVSELSKTEPVILVTSERRLVPQTIADETGIRVECLPIDDAWARDTTPLFVRGGAGKEFGTVFGFNGWGGKYDFRQDATLAARLCDLLHVPSRHSKLTLEGGSLDSDGRGTALAVETSVLNHNRNPGATRESVTEELAAALGLIEVLWLPFGLLDDTDTDGHVDNVARFVTPDRIVVQAQGRDAEDTSRLRRNLSVLSRARSLQGRQFDLVEIPWLPAPSTHPRRPASYCNFYITNDSVLVPVVGHPADESALGLIEAAVGRPAVPVDARVMAIGGGGPHCITMPRFVSHTQR